jgi:hypothetical protein
LLLDVVLTWTLSLPMQGGGQCGWACLSPVQLSSEGTRLPVRHRLVPLCSSGRGALLGDARPLDFGTCGGADYLGTWIIDFYIGCMAFTRVCLHYVGIIIMCMRVFLVKSPPQSTTEQVSYSSICLLGARECCRCALSRRAMNSSIPRGHDVGHV